MYKRHPLIFPRNIPNTWPSHWRQLCSFYSQWCNLKSKRRKHPLGLYPYRISQYLYLCLPSQTFCFLAHHMQSLLWRAGLYYSSAFLYKYLRLIQEENNKPVCIILRNTATYQYISLRLVSWLYFLYILYTEVRGLRMNCSWQLQCMFDLEVKIRKNNQSFFL